ncbi:hypothetical protein CSE16_08695 [Solibacillus sp. R5-41]|uniref:hypothetical protein n=1 Tax=Solibacillus sp. R5-41 TaxID=2048654 RepID=UPI000C128D29|nr:hypothetical protein [Solibacillus sp. R5-41]ATP40122.1 hypothetical protein CSE16_08695 [Solibacillus sp. R5-41]
MKVEEIKRVLSITGKEPDIFLPNEIFSDLQGYLTNSKKVAFAYSYCYLTQFLYRNCKYFNTEELIDNNVIKQILGYSESNRTMNDITKRKGGLLEEIGYLESTKDFPLSWNFKKDDGEGLSFLMSSEMDKDMLPPIPKMFFLKKPLKAFERTILKQNVETNQIEEVETGAFYDVSNTHSVDFNVFMYCMANKELGTTGFYLYSWLKHKHDIFRNGYDVSYEKLSAETGLPRRTMIQYLNALKGYNLISFKFNQQYYVIGMADGDRMATTYYANSYSNFYEEPKPFKKMMVMSKDDYNKRNDVVVTMEQLPF